MSDQIEESIQVIENDIREQLKGYDIDTLKETQESLEDLLKMVKKEIKSR